MIFLVIRIEVRLINEFHLNLIYFQYKLVFYLQVVNNKTISNCYNEKKFTRVEVNNKILRENLTSRVLVYLNSIIYKGSS